MNYLLVVQEFVRTSPYCLTFPGVFQAPAKAEGLSQQPKRRQNLFAILAFGHPEWQSRRHNDAFCSGGQRRLRRGNQRESAASIRMRMPAGWNAGRSPTGVSIRRRRVPFRASSGDYGRPGNRWFFLLGRNHFCARPPRNRSPIEAFHEVPEDQYDGRRSGEGVDQHSHGLSYREGFEAALAKEGSAGKAPARSAREDFRSRDRAAAAGGSRHPPGRHFRGDDQATSRTGQRH